MKNKFYFFRLLIYLLFLQSSLTLVSVAQNVAGSNENLPGTLKPDEIYSRYHDAVVYVFSYDEDDELNTFGSGVIVSPDGIVFTNYHVINDAALIKIKQGEKIYDSVKVYSFDEANDAAVLKIEGDHSVFIPIETENMFIIGEEVYAFGNPRGLERTISSGILSGFREMYDQHLIQFDASISHGSSGGALINKYGKLIGITCSSFDHNQNLNFAVPVAEFRKMLVYNICDTAVLNRQNELWTLYSEGIEGIYDKAFSDSLLCLAASDTSSFEKIVEAARYFRCFKNNEMASQLYSQAIVKDPSNAVLYLYRSKCYEKDSTISPLTDLNTALLYDSTNIRAYLIRAEIYFDKKLYKDAINDYTKVLQMRPDYYSLFLYRAECYLEAGYQEEAISDLGKSIWSDIKDLYGFLRRARLYEKLKMYSFAADDYTEALRIYEQPDYYLFRAYAYLQNEMYGFAIKDYNIYLNYYPQHANALSNLGYCYLAVSDLYAAEINFRKAVKFSDNNFDAYLGLAITCYRLNKKSETLKAISMAVKSEKKLLRGTRGLLELKEKGFFWSSEDEDTLIKIFEMIGIEEPGDPSNKRAVRSDCQEVE